MSAQNIETGSEGTPASEAAGRVATGTPSYRYYKDTDMEVVDDYICMLNQANIDNNHNKFYALRVFRNKSSGKFHFWTAYERTWLANKWREKLRPPVDSKQAAVDAFKKKFKEQTRCEWDKRTDFEAKDGSYTPIDIIHEADTSETSRTDEEKRLMPLGRLSTRQIEKGLKVLGVLEEKVKSSDSSQLTEFSNRFYTLIPHEFKRNEKPPRIESILTIQNKSDVLKSMLKWHQVQGDTQPDETGSNDQPTLHGPAELNI